MYCEKTAPKGVLQEILTTRPARDTLVFWWLGQLGLAVKTEHKLLFFDLFLSDNPGRLVEAPFLGREAVGADLVLGSHNHLDHIDLPFWEALAAADPHVRFVAPELAHSSLYEQGFAQDRLLAANDGVPLCVEGVTITGVAAAHENLVRDPVTGNYPDLGFLVEVDGFRIYHSGDTCVYDGLLPKLTQAPLDLCILPINGRDASRYLRDCIGNMTWQEAADLMGAIAPRLGIPGHYDMFAGNTADPGLFLHSMRVKYPQVHVALPRYCEAITLIR